MRHLEPFEDFGDVDEIAEGLSSADASVRRLAVIELAETSNSAAVSYLARATADPSSDVRLQAARTLGEFDGSDVAEALVRAVIDPVPDVARAAADSLAELRDPEVSEVLLPFVSHRSSFVRAAIFRALKALHVNASLSSAVAALADSDAAVRAQAVGVIG